MKILRPEVINDIPSKGGMLDLFDGAIYSLYNITSDELDTKCNLCTDEEMDVFVGGLGTLKNESTFTERRKGLEVRNKYVEYFKR